MSDYSNNYKNVSSALQKAREVAAKLQLAGPNKRSQEDFDDNEPHSKRFSSGSMSPAHLQQAQHAAAQVAARLGQQQNSYQQQQQHVVPNPDAVEKAKQLISKFIPQGQGAAPVGGSLGGGASSGGGMSRPGLGSNNYTEIMVPGSKVGLIIGKGGETIKQLQERTGAKMVVIQDGPGQEMEKPLRISGDAQKVEHAKQLVYELLEDKGPQQSQQGGGGGGGGGRGGSYNNRNQEHGGNGGSNYGNNGGDQIEVFVPKAAVGVVIGKGGDMIKKIQADTGCRLQFLQTKNEGPGDRRCILQGTKQQVDDGKRMIEDLIDSVMRRNNGEGGGGGGNRGGNDNWNSGGSSNNSYQQQHQQSPSSMGGGSSGNGGSGVQVVQHQYQFIVPASKCGIIIGRGGDTIKQINQQSGAHCEMDRKASQNQTNEKTFTVKGEQHQVDEAKRLIQDKINMDVDLQHIGSATVTQSSNGFGGGGQSGAQNPYQTWGGSAGNGSYNQGAAAGWDQSSGPPMQPGGAPGGNQADYSLQWIEYYRSMGMHQQADAIEAQVKTRQPTPGAPPSVPSGMMPGGNVPQQPQQPQPGSGGSQDNVRDYSQEWANYYRQIGRVDEAEAIERQIKTRGTATSNSPSGYGDGNNYQPPQQQHQHQYQPQQQQQYGQQYGNYNYQQQYGQNNSNDKNCRSTRYYRQFRKYYPRYRHVTYTEVKNVQTNLKL